MTSRKISILKSSKLEEDDTYRSSPLMRSEKEVEGKVAAEEEVAYSFRRTLPQTTIKLLDIALNISLIHWLYTVYSFSSSFNPAYQVFKHKLKDGWIPGRKIDNTDHQYAAFRKNIPVLMAVLVGSLLVSRFIALFSKGRSSSSPSKFSASQYWRFGFSLIFVFALFGIGALKILAITFLHFNLISYRPRSIISPITSWIFCISILFLNSYFNGYQFGAISSFLSFLDKWNGVGLRWNITFNFSILRMISFSMDRYWALHSKDDYEEDEKQQQHASSCLDCSIPPNLCKRKRMEKPLKLEDYNFLNYQSYLLYAPLYLAGPIVSYNDFWHQMHHTPTSINIRDTIKYSLRWIACVLLMEGMMHYFYVVAIKDTKAWQGNFSPFEIFLVGFFNLKMIWLKLLIMWRFFRMWAMTDGVETVENMGRCMSNHYSGVDFWREWHSSFNKWIIRYIYVPLGGSKYRVINMFPIFTFVAIWHDIEGRLLAWGWLIALFILPEILSIRLFVNPTMRKLLGDYHLHLCALGGTLNIVMMMVANLVGFAVGVDGVQELVSQIFQTKGIFFTATVGFQLFGGTHRMFWYRENERLAKLNSSKAPKSHIA